MVKFRSSERHGHFATTAPGHFGDPALLPLLAEEPRWIGMVDEEPSLLAKGAYAPWPG